MILFDNIYYLLYNYFERSKPVTHGPKLTSLVFTSLYILVSIFCIFSITKIVYFFVVISGTIGTSLTQDKFFLLNNDFVFYIIVTLNLIFTYLRYFAFKNINKIHDKLNEMNRNKRERINLLTVSYMVASPFLLFFLVNYVKDLYR